MPKRLLIVDDNIEVCKSLIFNFQRHDYVMTYALNQADALTSFIEQPTDAILVDLRLGEENGIDLLRHLLCLSPQTPIIMLTGYATVQTAVEAIKLGAYDFVEKPVNFQKLYTLVEQAIQRAELARQTSQQTKSDDISAKIITKNPAMIELFVKARKLANSTIPILIFGESGTGKELIADFIHAHSSRRCREIVKINCSAFPETLIDNELFGHEKGAFTGANAVFQGVFERAHQSTLFLDEIAEMPLPTQAKILRVIQNQEIRRIGGKDVINIDTRLIGATNKDLARLVQEKAFREDLYYRLNAAILTVPPLRERREDMIELAEFFLREFTEQSGAPVKLLSSEVIELFHQHEWPGNVRELKNTIHYAATMSMYETIRSDDLPPSFHSKTSAAPESKTLDIVEKNLILTTLKKTNFNKKKTAELLNMSRRTLYNKLEKYGILDVE